VVNTLPFTPVVNIDTGQTSLISWYPKIINVSRKYQ